jgi:phosphate transport system substrate-binding protein
MFKQSFRIAALCALMLVSLSSFAAGKKIQIKGSDTMVNLMSNLAEEYMTAHPDQTISVTGGGSGTGIAALINRTTDICAASRSWKQEEIDQANAKNVNPTPLTVGLDGLAVFVNLSNPVNELSLEQIKKIYTGEYTNWKDVGGPDNKIDLLSRESNSGTYVYFQEHVLAKADYSKHAMLLPSTAAVTKGVTDDAGAIGYGGIAYAEHAKVKMLHVKNTADSPAVAPSTPAVLDGSYPISRPLFLYTNGTPGAEVKAFLDFCMSDAGQKILTDTGYISQAK